MVAVVDVGLSRNNETTVGVERAERVAPDDTNGQTSRFSSQLKGLSPAGRRRVARPAGTGYGRESEMRDSVRVQTVEHEAWR